MTDPTKNDPLGRMPLERLRKAVAAIHSIVTSTPTVHLVELLRAAEDVLAMPREQPVGTPKASPSAVDERPLLRKLRKWAEGELGKWLDAYSQEKTWWSYLISEIDKLLASAPTAPDPAMPLEDVERASLLNKIDGLEMAATSWKNTAERVTKERDEWKAKCEKAESESKEWQERAMSGYQAECDQRFIYDPVVDILCKRVARLLTKAEARRP